MHGYVGDAPLAPLACLLQHAPRPTNERAMNAAHASPGGLALGELQHLVLVAALHASALQPEALEPHELGGAARSLVAPLENVAEALGADLGGSIGDVAAVARWELRRTLETLHGLIDATPGPRELARLGALRGSVLGALDGLERALVEHGDLAPVLGGIALLETRRALAMRQVFVSFRAEVRGLGHPSADGLRDALGRIAGRLVAMRDGRGLRRLRIGDRLQVESLLARIAAATESAEGGSVWRDVEAYAEVLLEVNRRAELRAHDATLAGNLARELAARPGVLEQIAFRRQLDTLRGRDDELDRLLDAGGEGARILRCLEAIAGAAA